MSEENKRRCHSCLRYAAYYTKGISRFDKLGYGLCHFTGERLQEKHGTCEHWERKYNSKKIRRRCALIVLERAADSICVLRQIFEEEKEGVK